VPDLLNPKPKAPQPNCVITVSVEAKGYCMNSIDEQEPNCTKFECKICSIHLNSRNSANSSTCRKCDGYMRASMFIEQATRCLEGTR